MNQLIPLYIILPLGAAFLIPVIGKLSNIFAKIITSLIFFLLLVLCSFYIFNTNQDTLTYMVGGWKPVDNIPIAIYLVLDGLSAIVLGIVNLIAFLSTLYAFSYIKKYTAENNFYALLCLMVAGMNGVVLTGDLFNLYVFLEIASIASYALVAFGIEKEELEASFKYQVLGGMASLIILLGIGFLYWATSTLNIADISVMLTTTGTNKALVFIQLLLISGFGLKAAVVPFHAWLPDAHSSAPAPISSLLSGVLIKAVGIYVIARLFFNMFAPSREIALTLLVLGSLSMVVGGLMAIGQWDYKRLLAYSSISQVGYIVLGIGIGMLVLVNKTDTKVAAFALFGALFHLINHAVFKGLLFMTAGAVEYATGIRDLRILGGLGRHLPITSASSFSGSMAISGIPPFAGFFSKLVIVIAAIYAELYLLAFIAAAMSIVTLAYFLKYYRKLFLAKPKMGLIPIVKVPFCMNFSMVVLAIMCILLSALMIPFVREILITPAVETLINIIPMDT